MFLKGFMLYKTPILRDSLFKGFTIQGKAFKGFMFQVILISRFSSFKGFMSQGIYVSSDSLFKEFTFQGIQNSKDSLFKEIHNSRDSLFKEIHSFRKVSRDQFLKGCILKGNFLTAIPPSLHFAFQDDYSYEFFWMIKEFFLST